MSADLICVYLHSNAFVMQHTIQSHLSLCGSLISLIQSGARKMNQNLQRHVCNYLPNMYAHRHNLSYTIFLGYWITMSFYKEGQFYQMSAFEGQQLCKSSI